MRQADEPSVVADAGKGFTRLSRLAGGHIRVVAVRQQGRAKAAPRLVDAARAADVDEHEGVTVKDTALAQQVGHWRVGDKTFHTSSRGEDGRDARRGPCGLRRARKAN